MTEFFEIVDSGSIEEIKAIITTKRDTLVRTKWALLLSWMRANILFPLARIKG